MAVRHFIKVDGVQGESLHRDHADEIDVLSWSWGFSSPVAAGGGGSGVGRPVPADFSFVHRYDKASPALARAGASGRHLREAILTSRKSGEGQKDFLKVTMREVFITSVQHQGTEGQIDEIVSFSARQISTEYRPQDAKVGLGPPVSFGWNVATGQVT